MIRDSSKHENLTAPTRPFKNFPHCMHIFRSTIRSLEINGKRINVPDGGPKNGAPANPPRQRQGRAGSSMSRTPSLVACVPHHRRFKRSANVFG
jgi:hypothetical protein